jgi:hypothetical protein
MYAGVQCISAKIIVEADTRVMPYDAAVMLSIATLIVASLSNASTFS